MQGYLGMPDKSFEAYRNFFRLLSLRTKVINYLLEEKPNIFIGIDLPDFNFRIEKVLKENNIRIFHYVAPSVWAWRKNRIFTIKKNIDHLFTVFPHESKIFKKVKVPVTFVGHPLANKIPINPKIKNTRKKLNLPKNKIITLLPGSRISEIKNNLDLMFNSVNLINKEFVWNKLKRPLLIPKIIMISLLDDLIAVTKISIILNLLLATLMMLYVHPIL